MWIGSQCDDREGRALCFDSTMEQGTKTKKTIYVGGLADEVDEAALIETFSTFGVKNLGGVSRKMLTATQGTLLMFKSHLA